MNLRETTYHSMNYSIEDDRAIINFPQAYLFNVSPYKKFEFASHIRLKSSAVLGVKMVKVVITGEVAVGKTSLIKRFCNNRFDTDYKATIGVDFEVEKFYIYGMPFKVQLWDTAGQERFKCIASSYYRSSNAVIIVFDMSNIDSLSKAKQWKKDAFANIEHQTPLLFLVGTKRDLVSDSVWKEVEEMATNIAKDIGAELWIVSSKTGERVTDFFFRLAVLLFEAAVENESADVTSSELSTFTADLKLRKIRIAKLQDKEQLVVNEAYFCYLCNNSLGQKNFTQILQNFPGIGNINTFWQYFFLCILKQ